MQTFLPYPDYRQSAETLDRQRLGKQRVETWQILKALTDPTYGWQHHPAVKMWRGHEGQLVAYGLAVCDTWQRRGYVDTVHGRLVDLVVAYPLWATHQPPRWLGDEQFHLSHRAKLVAKLPEWYVPQFGQLPPMDYMWPV